MDLPEGIDINVEERQLGGKTVKVLTVDGVMQSAMYPEAELRAEPILEYSKKLTRVMEENVPKGPVRALLLGGGGFNLARIFLDRYKEGTMDAVECSGEILKLAKEHFFLDELMEDGRLRVIEADAFEYLEKTEEKYDLIINDVFVGNVPPVQALTDTTIEIVRSHLEAGGLYILNLISALEGSGSVSMQLELRILMRFFESVKAYPCLVDRDPTELHNIILACRQGT